MLVAFLNCASVYDSSMDRWFSLHGGDKGDGMSSATEPMTTISVRVPESMRDRIDALATATDSTRQAHALEALRRYVEAEAWQVELIAERLRQLDSGEIGYASTERVAAARAKRYSAKKAG